MTTFPQSGPAKKPKFYYGWLIVWLSFFTLGFHVVTRFSFGIFQVPLLEEFGWSRGLLSGAFSLSMATYALGAPFAGSLLEKKGPRAIMPWGSVILGLTFILCYFVSSLWHLYILFGLFAGYGLSLSGFSTHSAIMPRWFVKKRGRATGIALSGIGIGILVLAPLHRAAHRVRRLALHVRDLRPDHFVRRRARELSPAARRARRRRPGAGRRPAAHPRGDGRERASATAARARVCGRSSRP